MYALIRPGDHVVCVLPTYQQLYSIPQSFGRAGVDLLPLQRGKRLSAGSRRAAQSHQAHTRLICLNNPNNPTGALMDQPMLEAIVAMAHEVGAYVLCDEVYRHLTQTDVWSASIVDLYEKSISIGSMSKVFSAGRSAPRLGRQPRCGFHQRLPFPPRLQPHQLRHV